MKRLWVVLLALCTVAMSCVGLLTAGAEETNTEVWSIYSLKEDENGIPYFATPPAYAYTEKGLKVTPASTNTYTVQTDHAYYMDKGIYMELRVEARPVDGVLVFHIWDQNGVLVNNLHCGSGLQCLIPLGQQDSKYMMNVLYRNSEGGDDTGDVNILSQMKVNTPANPDGSETYSIQLQDGILRINGSIVAGMEEALAFLNKIRPDGSVYIGVSVLAGEQSGPIPITVTRFGTTADTAFVPGTTGELPETGAASDETIAPGPIGTEPSEGDGTSAPVPETTPDAETAAEPVESGNPTESRPAENDGDTEPEEVTTDSFKSPYEDKEDETRKEIHNEMVDGFIGQVDGIVSAGCGATVGVGGGGFLALLAAAYVGMHKHKKD